MNNNRFLLIKRYSVALVNVYGAQMTQDNAELFLKLSRELEKKQTTFFSLSMSDIFYNDFVDQLSNIVLPPFFMQLIDLLKRADRLILLSEVLKYIVYEYYKRNHIILCNIASAHELSTYQLRTIVRYLEKRLGSTLKYECSIDKQLIAGIRIWGKEFAWEYSVRKNIQQIEHLIARK